MKEEVIEKARALFVAGLTHRQIESEVRAAGHTFSRRCLYDRIDRGVRRPGLIERFGWKLEPNADGRQKRSGKRNARRGRTARETSNAFANSDLRTHSKRRRARSDRPKQKRERAAAPQQIPNPEPAAQTGDWLPKNADDFQRWLQAAAPGMQWDLAHQQEIFRQLQRVSDGTLKRLMIFMPPRHGKSELVTIRYSAWQLLRNPRKRVVIGSYNQHLANKFSRAVRQVLAEAEDKMTPEERGQIGEGGTPAAHVYPKPRTPASEAGIRRSPETVQCRDTTLAVNTNRRMFPASRNINTMSEWETALGGGAKAVGVGAGITGYGADLMVIDDPVKSRAQAESQTYRDKTYDWFRNDICTRLEPNAAMILIQTRWHEDDLAGRILNDMKNGGEQWEVVSLPAIKEEFPGSSEDALQDEDPQNDPPQDETSSNSADSASVTAIQQNRKRTKAMTNYEKMLLAKATETIQSSPIADMRSEIPSNEIAESSPASDLRPDISDTEDEEQLSESNEARNPNTEVQIPRDPTKQALWPERYPVAVLEQRKDEIGSYCFAALYQQTPSPAEGGILKREWFTRIVDAAPAGLRWCRGYDLAVSTKTTADYTASFRVARGPDDTFYIADGFRKRIDFPDQRRFVMERMAEEGSTQHGIESALHGQALVQDLHRDVSGAYAPLKAVRVDVDKVTRALSWANHAEAGRVALVRGPWIDDFLEEVAAFPTGRYDDQIDAVSLAIRMLARKPQVYSF